MSTPSRSAPARDLLRQVAVVVAQVACVLGTLVGLGVWGQRVEESSGGALAADATLLAPAGPAFSIWSVIYVGLAGYAIWQALPSQRTRPLHRRIGWLAAASMLLNALWLLVTQQGWIWLSVGVISALLGVLVMIHLRLAHESTADGAARWLARGTFGLYLGWVSVATGANLMAALADGGANLLGRGGEALAVGIVALVVLATAWLQRQAGPQVALALGVAWGTAWVAVGRLSDAPESIPVGIVAGLAAVVTLALWGRSRVQSRSA